MLYRQRNTSRSTLIILIVFGIIIGVSFFVYDNVLIPGATPTPAFTPVLQAQPTSASMVEATIPPNEVSSPLESPVMLIDNASIFIPSIGVSAPIINTIIRNGTWDVKNLGTNIGHLEGTSWLGENGNVVLSGHVEMADGRTGVFSTLDQIQVGDEVVIVEDEQTYTYLVNETREVAPSDLSVVYPSSSDQITLITCANYDFLSNQYATRLVVVALRVG